MYDITARLDQQDEVEDRLFGEWPDVTTAPGNSKVVVLAGGPTAPDAKGPPPDEALEAVDDCDKLRQALKGVLALIDAFDGVQEGADEEVSLEAQINHPVEAYADLVTDIYEFVEYALD